MEAVELKLSEVLIDNEKFRFDSEFVSKDYLAVKNILLSNNYKYLSKLHKFNARYKQPIYDDNSNIKVLNSQYIRDYFLDYESAKLGYGAIVPKEAVMINSTGVGTLGRVNINYLSENISVDNHVNIIVAKEINPYYLTMFLKSHYGQSQINRYYSGSSGQIEIYAKDFNNFLVAIFSNNFQLEIENLVKTSYQKLGDSKNLYKEAENLLLKELDLVDFTPSDENISIKSFKDSFMQTGRLDSEYYQPKYDEIIEKIKSYKGGFASLSTILIYIETGEYSEEYFVKNSNLKFYIRSTNISNDGLIAEDEDYFVNPSKFTKFVKNGDIITARVGTLGIFATVDETMEGNIYSDNVLCFRLPNNLNPFVYTLFLNNSYNKLLIERLSRGSVQQRLNQETLKDLVIPIINTSIQNKIEEKIKKSFELKEESKKLLDLAKKVVEIAIEKDEDEAMKFIKNN